MTAKPSPTINLLIAVAVEPDEGGVHAYCPALKGLHVGGATEKEALVRAKEAILVYLDSLVLHGDPLPIGPYLSIENEEQAEIEPQFLRKLTVPWPLLQISGASQKT